MVAHALVPELSSSRPPTPERLLPDAADGAVEVYPGNDGYEAYGYAAGGHYWAHLPGTASFRFLADESSVVAISDAEVSRDLVEDAYFRNVLPLVMQLRGYEVLHASAVSTPAGLVVLCGVSGAGKSTFASALSARGYPVGPTTRWCWRSTSEREAVALQVPFRLGLRSDAAAFLAARAGRPRWYGRGALTVTGARAHRPRAAGPAQRSRSSTYDGLRQRMRSPRSCPTRTTSGSRTRPGTR